MHAMRKRWIRVCSSRKKEETLYLFAIAACQASPQYEIRWHEGYSSLDHTQQRLFF
jgi:hypothetical protein